MRPKFEGNSVVEIVSTTSYKNSHALLVIAESLGNNYHKHNNYALSDVDECAEGTHNCSSNAKCTDIDGGYYCNCTEGFIRHGNSQLCEGVTTETTVSRMYSVYAIQ